MGLSRSLFNPLTSKLMPWREYYQRVLNTRPDKLIGYWPMWEPSGATAYDLSKQGNNGAYSNVTLAQRGMGDGRTAASFNGTTSKNNLYSAALAADVSVTELTLMLWLKITPTVWADGVSRIPVHFGANTTTNYFRMLKGSTVNQFQFSYVAGGTSKNVTVGSFNPSNFFCAVMTVSVIANQMKAHINGAQVGTTMTGLGTWVGALASNLCLIGGQTTIPGLPFNGLAAHCALWSTPLPADVIAYLGRYDPGQGT